MKNMLVISGLALALMSGTALAQVSVGTGADVGAGVNASGGGVDANAEVGVNSGTAANVADGTVDAETTAAVGAEGSVSATLNALDDDGIGFFTDDTRAEVRSQAEVETAFAQLSAEQQANLRAACAEGASGGAEITGGAGLCAAINQMAQ